MAVHDGRLWDVVGGVVMFRVHVGCMKVVKVFCANAP
jgi:hypothetical protein